MPGATTTTTTVDPDSKKSAKDTKEVSFQFKLYEILQREDFKDIVTWLPHGLSWKIIDSEALTKTVLPKFFRHGMYSSFKRQMSGWGFRRGIKVNEYNEYSHPVSPANVIVCVFSLLHSPPVLLNRCLIAPPSLILITTASCSCGTSQSYFRK